GDVRVPSRDDESVPVYLDEALGRVARARAPFGERFGTPGVLEVDDDRRGRAGCGKRRLERGFHPRQRGRLDLAAASGYAESGKNDEDRRGIFPIDAVRSGTLACAPRLWLRCSLAGGRVTVRVGD